MHFRTLIATALPLLSLTAQALPVLRRDFVELGNSPANAGGQDAGAVAASSSSGDASAQGSSAPSKSSTYAGSVKGSQSGSAGGDSASGSVGGDSASGSAGDGKGASGTSSAAKAARTRACDQGDQSLASGLQALVTIGLGQQAAALTLKQTVSAKQVNAGDFKTNQQRLQQFITTAKLQLQMTQAIADDGSFAQPQLASLQKSLAQQETTVKGLKGDASDVKTLASLQQSFKTATGVTQDGLSNAVVDCFLPINTVSG